MAEPLTSTAEGWRDDAARLGRGATIGATSGMLVGLVVGGIGGRLVMFVLRLTSDERLRGTQTDDDFEIGSFTSATVFLLVATTLLGAFGGVLYMGVRRFVPSSWRWLAAGVLAGVVGGAVVLDDEGVDFTELDPLLFAVVAFIALPAVFGALTSVLVERRMQRPWTIGRAWPLSLLPVFALLVAGAAGVVVVALVLAAGPVFRAVPSLRAAVVSPAATWLGRGLLAGLIVFATVHLIGDIAAIL
jgi:hypothetical protein